MWVGVEGWRSGGAVARWRGGIEEAVEAGVLAGRLAVRVPDDGPAPGETVGALAG